MATEAQIGAAARGGHTKPTGAGYLADDHLFAGATLGLDPGEAGGAEMFARRVANRHACSAPRRLREAQRTGNRKLIDDVARHPAAYCGHPRHDEDVEWLGEVLQWLGLRPTRRPGPPRKVFRAQRPQMPERGRCPSCRRMVALRVDGTVAAHRLTRGGEPCDGRGAQPVQEEA